MMKIDDKGNMSMSDSGSGVNELIYMDDAHFVIKNMFVKLSTLTKNQKTYVVKIILEFDIPQYGTFTVFRIGSEKEK